jgi:ketosteroid isomerase-like protein
MVVASPIDDSELRAAEQELARALGAYDRIAWVEHYTDDAVFIAPDVPAVQGRTALVEMARSMSPLSSVSIVPLRTDMTGDLAAVYTRASWVTGEGTSDRNESSVRGILVWRKDQDGTWRVAQELLHHDPDARREPWIVDAVSDCVNGAGSRVRTRAGGALEARVGESRTPPLRRGLPTRLVGNTVRE